MSGEAIVVTIVSAIISGVLATAITLYVNYKAEQRKMKRDLVDDIFGYRYQISNGYADDKSGILRALNRVPIVFCESNEVLEAYDDLYDAMSGYVIEEKSNAALIVLYKKMCKEAQIDVKEWGDYRMTRVFS